MNKKEVTLIGMIKERIDSCNEIIKANEIKLTELNATKGMHPEIKSLITGFLNDSLEHDKNMRYHYELMHDSIIEIGVSEENHKAVYSLFMQKLKGHEDQAN